MTPSGCPVTPGCPIRRSPDQRVFDHSPEHIAVYNVLRRLCTPRHPPYTLVRLTTFMNDCGKRRIRSLNLRLTKTHGESAQRCVIPTQLPIDLSKNSQRSALSHQPRPTTSFLPRPAVAGFGAPARCRETHDLQASPAAVTRGTLAHWSRPGSNRQPPRCKRGALPVELRPRTRIGRGTPDPRSGIPNRSRGGLSRRRLAVCC